VFSTSTSRLRRNSSGSMYFEAALSLTFQLALGAYLGHYYDIRVFMVSGYAVAEGLSPYETRELESVFDHPHFDGGVPGIGYPPPWGLLLGLIYQVSYNIFPNIFFYNVVIKLPVILGNLLLAVLVRNLLQKENVEAKMVKAAWRFFLFNPFVVYTTAVWGQFDPLVAFLTVLSVLLLFQGKNKASAILLGLAAAFKLIPVAFVFASLLFLKKKNEKIRGLEYILFFTGAFVAATYLPFPLLNWGIAPIFSSWNIHFSVLGGLSLFNIAELFGRDSFPAGLELLGYLWAPALIITFYILWRRTVSPSFEELVKSCLVFIFVLLLTRSWVSEQNLNLLFPFLILNASLGGISQRAVTLAWVIPFIFTFFNASFLQQLFLIYPEAIALNDTVFSAESFLHYRLILRFLVVIPWHIMGWWIVVRNLRS